MPRSLNFQYFANQQTAKAKTSQKTNVFASAKEWMSNKIYVTREQKFILDRDLAVRYGADTKRRRREKETLKDYRGITRFLSKKEAETLTSQITTRLGSIPLLLRHLFAAEPHYSYLCGHVRPVSRTHPRHT